MKLIARRGQTAKKIRVFIQDSSSATGGGLAGLTAASPGLTAYYHRGGDVVASAIPLSAGALGTWSSGGFIAVDPANMPGLYELGLPDACLAGGEAVVVYLKGAANMIPCLVEIELVAYDPQAAADLGLANLDAAISSRVAASALPANFGALAVTAGGAVTVGVNGDKTGYALAQAFPANFAALAISAAGDVNANVTRVNGSTASVTSAVDANITQWNGVPIAPPDSAGYPKVTLKSGTGPGEISLAGGNLAGSVAGVTGNVAGSVGSVVSGVTVADRAGFKLAPDGLDAIAVADPGAPANHTTIARMLVAIWRSIFRKSTLTATQLRMYADDGVTVNCTQVVADDGTTQTRDTAS